MQKLIKMAYNYIDDILEKLRIAFDSVSKTNPTLAAELLKNYRSISQKRNTPGPDLSASLQKAKNALRLQNNLPFFPKELQTAFKSTEGMTPFSNWEHGGFNGPFNIEGKIVNEPGTLGNPGKIILLGLKLLNSPIAQQLFSQLGPAISFDANNTVLKGTKEVWKNFCSLASRWSSNAQALANYPIGKLPSEKITIDKPNVEKQLVISIVNDADGPQDWELGKKSNELDYSKKGIRFAFLPTDENYFSIIDYATTVGLTIKPYYSSKSFVVNDLNSVKLYNLSKRLQHEGYPIKPLNDAIAQLTGKSLGEQQKETGKKEKKLKRLSPIEVKNSIQSNLIENPPDKDQFFAELETQYPEAYKVGGTWANAQKEGVYFATTRHASINADEPGSGKTVQSMIAADYVCKQQSKDGMNKKVLAIMPGILINENWISPTNGPMKFCGHSRDMMTVADSPDSFDSAVNDPKVHWIYVPHSAFANRTDEQILAAKISEAAKNGIFGALIMDEIQFYKDLESKSALAIKKAVSATGIPFRMGLTGTPADDNPSDVYSQLLFLRHPLLYMNKGLKEDGTKDLVLKQSQAGFTNQFLGGESYSNREDSNYVRMSSLFKWANEMDDNDMLSLLNLFGSTFIRRNKKDMRPDIPSKTVIPFPIEDSGASAHFIKREEELKQTDKNWHMTLLQEMAMAKVPNTVKKAVEHIKSNKGKLFVITKHPKCAKLIASEINTQIGKGIAVAVTGEDKNELKRYQTSVDFKNPEHPMKVVVYTMKLGAVGLNFSIATKAIFNDMDWNPSTNLQAEYRVHRINSTHPVEIEYQYFPGTYDETMFQTVKRKKSINDATNDIIRAANKSGGNITLAHELVIRLVDSLLTELNLSEVEWKSADMQKKALRERFAKDEMLPTTEPIAANTWYKILKVS